jgi:hypothetical protein
MLLAVLIGVENGRHGSAMARVTLGIPTTPNPRCLSAQKSRGLCIPNG